MLKVSQVKLTEHTVPKSKELEDFKKLMIKYGTPDPDSLLPAVPWHNVEFALSNTYSGFANALRRVLVEELPVQCLTFTEKAMTTDDEFILTDVLLKNINLIPINQDVSEEEYKTINFEKFNDTNDIIDVLSSDIVIGKNSKRGKEEMLLIPDGNLVLIRLRPGKKVAINDITFTKGISKQSAAKFSLLNNVKYQPTDMEPFDVFTGKGTRSIEYDPKEFKLSFTTAGNIKPRTVITLMCDELTRRLGKCLERLDRYMKSGLTDQKCYFSEGLEVTIRDDMNIYEFAGEYITIANMVAQRCFLLDDNVVYCSPTIKRYDSSEVAIIRLKHADANKLLSKSFSVCIDDVKIVKDELLKGIA